MTEEDKLIDKVVIAAAKILAKEIKLDEERLLILTAEILSQKYQVKFGNDLKESLVLRDARKLASQAIATKLINDVRLA